MKISSETFNVLKSFSQINQSIAIDRGNEIRTISKSRNMVAKAVVEDRFDNSFAIYDLSQFIAICNTLTDPQFEFTDTQIIIKSVDSEVRYTYCAPEMIQRPPEDDIELDQDDLIIFNIPETGLKKVLQAATVLQLPDFAFVGDTDNIGMFTTNLADNTSNQFEFKLDQVGYTSKHDKEFVAVINVESMQTIMSGEEFTVEISPQGLCRIYNDMLQYWFALEQTSKF